MSARVSWYTRQTHNLKVAGSNPAPATTSSPWKPWRFQGLSVSGHRCQTATGNPLGIRRERSTAYWCALDRHRHAPRGGPAPVLGAHRHRGAHITPGQGNQDRRRHRGLRRRLNRGAAPSPRSEYRRPHRRTDARGAGRRRTVRPGRFPPLTSAATRRRVFGMWLHFLEPDSVARVAEDELGAAAGVTGRIAGAARRASAPARPLRGGGKRNRFRSEGRARCRRGPWRARRIWRNAASLGGGLQFQPFRDSGIDRRRRGPRRAR